MYIDIILELRAKISLQARCVFNLIFLFSFAGHSDKHCGVLRILNLFSIGRSADEIMRHIQNKARSIFASRNKLCVDDFDFYESYDDFCKAVFTLYDTSSGKDYQEAPTNLSVLLRKSLSVDEKEVIKFCQMSAIFEFLPRKSYQWCVNVPVVAQIYICFL